MLSHTHLVWWMVHTDQNITDFTIHNFYEHMDMDHEDPKCTFHRENGDLYGRYSDKDVRLTYRSGNIFLKLSTILQKGGINFVRFGLGFENYNRIDMVTRDAASDVIEAVDNNDPSLDDVISELEQSLEDDRHTLLPQRELMGLDRQLRTIRGTLAAQESKRVEILQEISEEHDINEISKLEERRDAVQDSIDTLRQQQHSQIRQIRDLAMDLAYSDLKLKDKLKKLFREQGITISAIITAVGFIITSIVLTLSGGSEIVPPTPTPHSCSHSR